MPLWGTAHASDSNKPKFLPEDENSKYTKGNDWTAISLYGYGPKITDILKPGVLKSSVNIDEQLQWTNLHEATPLNPVFKILENLPCKYERVRFMKLEAGKVIVNIVIRLTKIWGLMMVKL